MAHEFFRYCIAGGPVSSVPELGGDKKLLNTVERWLRLERDTRQERAPPVTKRTSPFPAAASRHMAFYR